MAVISELINWARTQKEKNNCAYLLLDSAHAENSYLQLDRWKVPYESLFDDTAEESLAEIAPLIIPLVDLTDTQIKKVCDWSIALAYKAPCLSWFGSSSTVTELADHLRQFHTVSLSEGQDMMMRWYDTRILPVWLACLDSAQKDIFLSGILSINYINRFGETAELFMSETTKTLVKNLPLGTPLISLSDAQLSMLIDASEVDTLVSHLRRVITDETNQLTSRALIEFTGKYQQKAIDAGILDLDRQTQYLLLALYTSGKGVEHQDFLELLKNPPTSLDGFYAAMQSLPEEIWNTGLPLWLGQTELLALNAI